ncbi:hypothetical protein RhiirC2_802882, partial [Rhizophagus irregularis]
AKQVSARNLTGDSDLYPLRDDLENRNYFYNNGWDDAPTQDTNSGFNLPPHTSPSLMDTSPDASFSALDPNSVLSRRHVPLPNSRPTIITPMLMLLVCNWKFLMSLIHKRIFQPNLVRLWKNWTPSLFND